MAVPDPTAHPRGARAQRSGFRSLAVAEGEGGPPFEPGTLLGDRFRVVSRLGEGGMGEVYVAEQREMDRRVALKVVRSSLASDEQMLERFRREARAASRIRSRHVVTVYDFGRDAETGRLFIAMELLEGETLAARLERDGRLPVADAARIGGEVCAALDAAHRAGVVHRDLKPENVFIEPDGNVKVLDFGIARLFDPEGGSISSHATMTATIVGTPAYISPEAAARNKNRPIEPTSDLYSLGVMLFEMLTGQLPFDDVEPMILIGLHLRAPPQRMRDLPDAPPVSESLDDLVDELLAKEPSERPRSAAIVQERLRLAALEAAAPRVAAHDVQAEPVRPHIVPVQANLDAQVSPSAPRLRTTNRVRWAAAGIGVFVVAAVVLAFNSPAADPPPAPAPPVAAPAVAEPVVAPAPATIRASFVLTPPNAQVELDGALVRGGFIELPRDGARHVVVANVGRRRSGTVSFVADIDRTIELAVPAAVHATKRRSAPPAANTTKRRTDLFGLIRDEE